MTRPCLCWFCHAPAIVEVQIKRPTALLKLDASIVRGDEWIGRYVCAEHEHLDPWDVAA